METSDLQATCGALAALGFTINELIFINLLGGFTLVLLDDYDLETSKHPPVRF